MRKLKIQDAEVMKVALQQEIVRSEEARYDHRLHGVLLVCAGKSCYEVADLLGHSPRTIQYWVERFEQSGFAGLEDQEREGRPTAILCLMKKVGVALYAQTRAKKIHNSYRESSSCEMGVRVRKYFRKEEVRYTG